MQHVQRNGSGQEMGTMVGMVGMCQEMESG
jgi:hypothetical protein